MSIGAHTEAWRAELTAAFGGHREVLTWDEAQKRRKADTLPDRYVLFDVSHRAGAPRHMQGRTPMRGWRLSTLHVGREWERMWSRDRMDALTDRRIASLRSTALTHESDDETDDHDLSSQWTYASPL